MATLDQLQFQLAAKKAELAQLFERLSIEEQRIKDAKRFTPSLRDTKARDRIPIVTSQITALENKIDELNSNIEPKATMESQEKKGINPLIILGGLGLVLLL